MRQIRVNLGGLMVFVDGIVLTRRFERIDSIKVLCGLRSLAYREPGDVDREGKEVIETEVVGEHLKTAWIRGSHESKMQIRSDGTTLSIKGNPGRWCRADNLFNLGFDETIAMSNKIVAEQGFPADSFSVGRRDPFTRSQLAKFNPQDVPEDPWTGARLWSIHLTQNYTTGSPEAAKAVIDWLNTQSVARVKKSRLGLSTIIWGSIKYRQTEVYIKADEMLAHCKTPEAKKAMRESDAYQYALSNGIIRLEVKCAKDFLKHRKLTFLGNWDMGTVIALFKEGSEILERCAVAEAGDEAAILASLPAATRVHAAAWYAGIDVSQLMSRATFYRHAKTLRGYGIDISEPRNITVIRPKMREIEVAPAAIPSWYQLSAA
jgi:hypothetical protein